MKDFKTRRPRPGRFEKFRVALLAGRYHTEITEKLLDGARRALKDAGLASEPDVFWVDGAYELPQAASALARSGRYDFIVPLGCILRGETAHFEHIARTVASGLDAVGRDTGVPVSFGVLTVDTAAQARDRAGGKWGNKGEEAALAALGLARLFGSLKTHGKPKKSA